MPSSRVDTQPAPPIQDLTRDKLLLDAPRIPYRDTEVPALGGIPLLYELGRGGMGAVYYGVHPRLMQDVAVKVLSFSADDADPAGIERFRREAEMGARVRSDHLVGVLDVNEDSGLHFIVMEFVDGMSAQELLRQLKKSGTKGLPEIDALNTIIAVSEGLAAAHEKGVVHRDVKPGNVLIPRGSKPPALSFHRTKLADLGLAYCESLDFRMTRTGAVMGTPGFMAPEQVDDSKACMPSADVFSMGVTLYALLAGSGPFAGKGLRATLELPHKPIRDVRPDLFAATAEIVEHCLQKDPARRYPDGLVLLGALMDCLESRLAPVTTLPVSQPAPAQADSTATPAVITPPELSPASARIDSPEAVVHVDTPTVELPPPAPARVEAPPIPEVLAEIPEFVPPIDAPVSSIQLNSLPATQIIDLPTKINWTSSIDLWKSLSLEFGGGEKMFLMLIPSGRFQMGSADSERGRGANEKLHTVEISRPFYMGKFAVTQRQYKALIGSHRSHFRGLTRPVENVSWQDATIFCDILSEQTFQKVQLPTEAQWEFACRAGTSTPFHFGYTITPGDANYNGTYANANGQTGEFRKATTPVGSFKPNAFDLYDMHGNVYEWCRDAYMQGYEKLGKKDPVNAHGEAHVVKGGSWYDFPGNCRSACRGGYSDAYPYVGFRVVVDARKA